MQVLSDKEVATRLRGGDVEAFAELYKRYHSRVRRFALKLLRDPSAAADIAQETFMKSTEGCGYVAKRLFPAIMAFFDCPE